MTQQWPQLVERIRRVVQQLLEELLARLGIATGQRHDRIVPQHRVLAFLTNPPKIDMSGGAATQRSLEEIVKRRIELGWQRTDGATPYLPDLPKLFYVARQPLAEADVRTIVETARQSIPWRTSKTPAGDTTAWTQTHAVTTYAKHSLSHMHQVRGFRGTLALPPESAQSGARELTVEVFAYVNRLAPDSSLHHAVLSLEFDMPGTTQKWARPIEEQRVSEVVAATAVKLSERLESVGEILLLSGAWRYVFFDVPYEASYLRKHPELLPAADAGAKARLPSPPQRQE